MFRLEEKDKEFLFSDESQKIRIRPLAHDIFRITVTKKEQFSDTESRIVICREEIQKIEKKETDDCYKLITKKYVLQLEKSTGRIVIRKGDRIVMAEAEQDGKLLSEFDSYKNIFSDESDIKTSGSVDGVRVNADNYKKVFYKKLYKCKLSFSFQDQEALYGFGSHEEGFGNLRGKYRELYQQNLKACIPYFYSTNGYGCLFNANCFMEFHDDAHGSYVWLDAAEELDYYIICGDGFDQVTAGYRYLTGSVPMLPKWAFGYCQSKERYVDAEELMQVVEEYRRREIPLDLIILDWQSWPMDGGWGQKTFDPKRFPNPEKMLEEIHNENVKFMISIWPIMTGDCENQKEMKKEGCMLGNQSTYNAFSKKARDLYWKQANEGLFQKGVDAWWCDCTEPFENDWYGSIKPEPFERVNLNTQIAKKYIEEDQISAFSLMHSKGIYEGQRKTSDAKRVVNLTRSAYAGQHRYATITWAGDTSANWETLKRHIPEGVNFCAAGEPYWTVDIGAFFVRRREQWFWNGEYEDGCRDLGYRELYTRWLQYAVFLPMFRSHGTDTPREIWQFGEKGTLFYDAIEKFIKLRYRLLPYIYSLAGMVTHKNYTMMRALAFDFQDEEVKQIDHQFLFGPALMICPITRPMYYTSGSKKMEHADKTQRVYLPKGADWYDFWTGEWYEGGQYIIKEYPIDRMPIFVKAGSILPMSDAVAYTGLQKECDITLRVYAGNDAEFELYEDEEDNYHYENGAYAWTKFSWKEETKQLSIGQPSGEFEGRVKDRIYQVIVIDKENPYQDVI